MIMLLLIVLIVFYEEVRQCEYIVMCTPGILVYSETRRYVTRQVY